MGGVGHVVLPLDDHPQVTVHLLGTGGWLPSDIRETSCYAVRSASSLLLLDASTGLRRLVTESAVCDGITRIDIALSHFHLDHVIGLSYLDALSRDTEVCIWGVRRWLYGETTNSIISRLLCEPFGSAPRSELYDSAHELNVGTDHIGPHPVRVRAQMAHSQPSVGFRYSDDLAYCTDTAFDSGNIDFTASVSVLLHDAWVSGSAGTRFHSSAVEAARIAEEAAVQRLVLIHLDPRLHPPSLVDQARKIFSNSELGIDSLKIRPG